MTKLYQTSTRDNCLWGWDICLFGFVFVFHKADCRVSGIWVVKGFGVLHDRSLDLEFFMWLVRIQTVQTHKKRMGNRDDRATPGQR